MPKVFYQLIFIGFSIMMGMSLSSSFLPILAKSLDPSGLLVSLVVSAWFLSRVLLELPAGIISDRIGRRRLLILGIGVSALGPLICSQATNIYMLIIGRAFWGMGTAFYFMNNFALLMDILPPNIRGRAIGLFQGIDFIGSFIGAPIGAYLTTLLSYNQVFYFTLGLTLVSLIVALRSESLKGVESQKTSRALPPIKDILISMKDWGITVLCINALLRMVIMQGIFQTMIQLFFHNKLQLSVALIGILLSLRIIGQIISLFSAGMLSDRFGRKPVLISGFGLNGFALFFFTMVKGFNPLLFVSFLTGLGEGFCMTTLIALLSDLAPPNMRGGVIGVYRTFQDIGGFGGPVLFMIVYTNNGPIIALYLAALLCLFSILLMATSRSQHSAHLTPGTVV